ncbi:MULTISPECIES: DUF1120 domain-containing protein [unclassified Herbaspirillum]|uniref:DUF1120 domain-containing protein n=1 Tax=unclassified Herbaspirillum TaxID=2624150 RepID=UPI00114EF7D2|nr:MULTISPECIES: DUF1120 domain-containing protein [unclassified Herbaspirillum]MBB5392069.1 hypothetical protein [Herbaspirillum sp. SJZ102]TQK13527.1 uncharacterized protein DUF1120 [Herbaspirillum sp. SJZ130]TQK15530.1 uncharacterized protein DUF1120 [Herbaspirillum sp. SJZ106]TWC71430.1 uncharacterized protein DUF1120 [Herbaspirillum sp. SJZ099]
MKRWIFCIFWALAVPAAVLAGTTAQLRVTGRIVPNACVPNFIGGGVIDYGAIPSGALSPHAPTLLPARSVGLQVSCGIPASVALRLVDNRPLTATEGMVKTSARPSMLRDGRYFGLKNEQGLRVGGYVLRFEPRGDAASPNLQMSAPGNAASGAWTARTDGMLLQDTLYTWAAGQRNIPAKMQQMDATLSIQPVIDARNGGLADEIPLDGSATFELVYL